MEYEYLLTISHNWPIYVIVALLAAIFILCFKIRKQNVLIRGLKRAVKVKDRMLQFLDQLDKLIISDLKKQSKTDSGIIAKNMDKIIQLQIENAVFEEQLELHKFDYELLRAKLNHKKRPVKQTA